MITTFDAQPLHRQADALAADVRRERLGRLQAEDRVRFLEQSLVAITQELRAAVAEVAPDAGVPPVLLAYYAARATLHYGRRVQCHATCDCGANTPREVTP